MHCDFYENFPQRQVGFSRCCFKSRFSFGLQGLMVGDLTLAISLEGGGLRLPPGLQLMLHSQLVPGNMQRSSGPSQSSTRHTYLGCRCVLRLRAEHQERDLPSGDSAQLAGTQKQAVCQVQSYLGPMGPRRANGAHPSQRRGSKIKFPQTELSNDSFTSSIHPIIIS